MDMQRKGVGSLAVLVVAILLVITYSLFIRGYLIEDASIAQYAEQAVTSRFGVEGARVRSVERINGGRTAAFIFKLVDSAGREYHLAAAFRQSPFSDRYQAQDMFLIENYFVTEHPGILTAQDYLRSYRFDVRDNRLNLQASPSRLSAGSLGVAAMAIIICAAFLLVFNRGDQTGIYEAVEAEFAAESGNEPWMA